MKTYAGIGSRDTPRDMLDMMTTVAMALSNKGWTLYSGGAKGADTAFERGAGINKTIFLPWNGFNGHRTSKNVYVPEFAQVFVERYHPKPGNLSEDGWDFMSRNTYQVLGPDLKSPVDFVLCWTKDGKASGGTGQAMRIAKDKGIPIYNFNGDLDKIKDLVLRIDNETYFS